MSIKAKILCSGLSRPIFNKEPDSFNTLIVRFRKKIQNKDVGVELEGNISGDFDDISRSIRPTLHVTLTIDAMIRADFAP